MLENDDALEKGNLIIFGDEAQYMLSRDEKWEDGPVTNSCKPIRILLESELLSPLYRRRI